MNTTEFREKRKAIASLEKEVSRIQANRDKIARIAKLIRSTYEYRKGIISIVINAPAFDVRIRDGKGENRMGNGYLSLAYIGDLLKAKNEGLWISFYIGHTLDGEVEVVVY